MAGHMNIGTGIFTILFQKGLHVLCPWVDDNIVLRSVVVRMKELDSTQLVQVPELRPIWYAWLADAKTRADSRKLVVPNLGMVRCVRTLLQEASESPGAK